MRVSVFRSASVGDHLRRGGRRRAARAAGGRGPLPGEAAEPLRAG